MGSLPDLDTLPLHTAVCGHRQLYEPSTLETRRRHCRISFMDKGAQVPPKVLLSHSGSTPRRLKLLSNWHAFQLCFHCKTDTSDSLMSACTGMVLHFDHCRLVAAWIRHTAACHHRRLRRLATLKTTSKHSIE